MSDHTTDKGADHEDGEDNLASGSRPRAENRTPRPAGIRVLPVPGIGDVQPGADLAELIAATGVGLRDDDILLVTSKVVSKSEGRLLEAPTEPAAREAARQAAVSAESVRVVASRGPTRIVQTRHGLVLAAAGIDASNVDPSRLVLLPLDPDASARRLRADLRDRLGVRVAVVVTDTMGRTWRNGQIDVAIGAAGIAPLRDHRGATDPYGNELSVTVAALADELAAAGDLVKGKTTGIPVAVVRGLGVLPEEDGPGAVALVRPAADDMFSLGTAEARAEGRRELPRLLHAEVSLRAGVVDRDVLTRAAGTALAPFPDRAQWRVVVVASSSARARLAAEVPAVHRPEILDAPGLLLLLRTATPGAHAGPDERAVDLRWSLRTALAAEGLAARPLRADPHDAARRALDLPAGWTVEGAWCAGYPAKLADTVLVDSVLADELLADGAEEAGARVVLR